MPQINQLSQIFLSQLFWLAVVFGIIYFVIGRGMVPKIRGTVGDREARIARDLELAQVAREEADRNEAGWRARMDEARSKAAAALQEARAASAAEIEARSKAAADDIARKIADSEAKVSASIDAAKSEIESIAAEAAKEMLSRLAGLKVDSKDAAAAVKAVANG